MQLCLYTQHPRLPLPSRWMLLALPSGQCFSNSWLAFGIHSPSSQKNYQRQIQGTALSDASFWQLTYLSSTSTTSSKATVSPCLQTTGHLIHAYGSARMTYSLCEIRQLAYLAELSVLFQQVKGGLNIPADALSRVEAIATMGVSQ